MSTLETLDLETLVFAPIVFFLSVYLLASIVNTSITHNFAMVFALGLIEIVALVCIYLSAKELYNMLSEVF